MVQIIILAGGMGKRMKSSLPKVLVEFNKKPMIIHVIEQSLLLDPEQILIVVGKNTGITIQETIKEWIIEHFDKLKFVLQDPPLGTGHAVQCCLKNLLDDNKTIILSGDVPNIKAATLRKYFLVDKTDDSNIYLLGFIPENNFGYGRIISENDLLLYICEEKECTDELKKIKICNSGVYCIPSLFLKNYIPCIENNNKANEYYLPDIFSYILEDYPNSVKIKTLSSKQNLEVAGINTVEQLKQLENSLE